VLIYQTQKSIVFTGFMGAGKTTIGKMIATALGRDFIDTDEEIETKYKLPASDIFKLFGEQTFREEEKKLVTSLCKEEMHVISLGGGAFLQEDLREVCMKNCIVIYLDITWEQWKERIPLILDTRPVLQGKSETEMKELFYKRKSIYSQHHFKINTGNQNPEGIAKSILEYLNTDKN
jgi:shikimate kinase